MKRIQRKRNEEDIHSQILNDIYNKFGFPKQIKPGSNTNAFEKAQYDYHGVGSIYRNRK